MTLIETVAAVTILGAALVSLVLASAKLTAQSRRAQDRIVACDIADSQLRQWWREPEKLPRNAGGRVPGHKGWTWRTRVTDNEKAAGLKGQAVVLEIRSPAARDSEPTAAVEIILPKKPNDSKKRNDAD